MLLYHGSKTGISGAIQPISRAECDFGRGFYMGTMAQQPLTLICNYSNPVLYTVELETAGLSILELPTNLDWALFVALNRGKLNAIEGTPLFNRINSLADGRDVIAGAIASDRMFIVLDRFFNGDITDTALIASLSALQLGSQYVAITQKACNRVTVLEERRIGADVLPQLREESERNRALGIARADAICREHRRDGRYFDEIIQVEG